METFPTILISELEFFKAMYLFVLVIDGIMRNAVPVATLGFCVRDRVGTRSRCTSPAVYVTDLDFADDIALLSSSAANMQIMILSIELRALKVGLKINGPKTEFIHGLWPRGSPFPSS
jgi:hypothetical protein